MSHATHPARHTGRTLAVLVTLGAVLTAGAPGIVHIRAGDTLWGLAHRHHTTVGELQRLNHLGDRTTIYIGQLLTVPGNASPVAARPRTRTLVRTHVVRSGDTQIGIARAYGVTVAVLRGQNHLRTDVVRLGARLVVTTHPRVAPARAAAVTTGGRRIPAAVRRSVAAHRAVLGARRQPGRLAVRRAVAAAARRYGVDPSFALAVAYHESGFQQAVVSPVDAIGVMQVLPSTGRLLGQAYGRRFDLLDPYANITAGVLLLRDLRRSTGSDAMALAGYYQGLGSVHEHGLLPQTRDYIRNVAALRSRFARA